MTSPYEKLQLENIALRESCVAKDVRIVSLQAERNNLDQMVTLLLNENSPFRADWERDVKVWEEKYDALRSRVAVLEKAVEWACGYTTDEQGCRLYQILSRDERDELRRRAKEGK